MTIHSSKPAWRIPWTEEPDGLKSIGLQRSSTTEVTEHAHMSHLNSRILKSPSTWIIPSLSWSFMTLILLKIVKSSFKC